MKQVWILGGLLAASLAGAWLTYTAEPDPAAEGGEVTLWRGSPADVQKVALYGDDLQVVVERRSDARGDYTWVTVHDQVVTRQPIEEVEGAPEGDEAEGAAVAEDSDVAEGDEEAPVVAAPRFEEIVEDRVYAFKGDERADQLWQAFGPLRALRQLSSEGDREAFGFDGSSRIEVHRRDRTVTVALGGRPFGGPALRYLEHDGAVYLVSDRLLRPLENARSRLEDRAIQPLIEPDVDRVDVQGPMGSLSLVHRHRTDRARAFWTVQGADQEIGEVAAWVNRLLRLRATPETYTPEADLPPGLQPLFDATIEGRSQVWTVRLLRTADATPEYYVASSYNRSFVQVPRAPASELVAELETLFRAAPAVAQP